jgi:phosphatidylethanolamine/phosphatidyl-N-methylethanolamine N-methyltransferase
MRGRKRAFTLVKLQPGERVLLVGVGTGADLPLLPPGIIVTGIDLSEDMLAQARKKIPMPNIEIILQQGDAQTLLVEEASFDVVVFNLILSVIPDGKACLRENLRALKFGGRVVVFDKFLPDSGKLSGFRRFMNFFSTLLGTDINRRFGDLAKDSGLVLELDEPSLMNGMYRIMLLRNR